MQEITQYTYEKTYVTDSILGQGTIVDQYVE